MEKLYDTKILKKIINLKYNVKAVYLTIGKKSNGIIYIVKYDNVFRLYFFNNYLDGVSPITKRELKQKYGFEYSYYLVSVDKSGNILDKDSRLNYMYVLRLAKINNIKIKIK